MVAVAAATVTVAGGPVVEAKETGAMVAEAKGAGWLVMDAPVALRAAWMEAASGAGVATAP